MSVLSVIKNEGSAHALVWRCPEEDFNINSTLIVSESEEALFVKNGMVVQIFSGGRYKLSTANYPFISNLRNKVLFGGNSPFNCKVYFVNKAHKLELFWGTDSPLQVRDAEFGFMVNIRARGSYSVQITDSKKFLVKLLGMGIAEYSQEDIENSFRSAFIMTLKGSLARMMRDLKVTVLDIAAEYDNIAASVKPDLGKVLDEYGIGIVNFYIVDVSIPEDDPNYERINRAYAEKGTVRIQGADWDRITAKEILKDAANNEGAGGTGAGIGIGLGALGAMGGMAGNIFGNINNSRAVEPQMNGNVYCTQCGKPNSPDAKFCSNCGSPLRASNICPKCGATIAEGAKFCGDCGEKL